MPETSTAILIIGSRDGLFRAGKTLARYFNERTDDPTGARDIINGDVAKNGPMIAKHHAVFLKALKAALLPAGSPVPVGPVTVSPVAPIPAVPAVQPQAAGPASPVLTIPAASPVAPAPKPSLGSRLTSFLMRPWFG